MTDIIIHKASRGYVTIEGVSEAGKKFMRKEFKLAPSMVAVYHIVPEETVGEVHQFITEQGMHVDLR